MELYLATPVFAAILAVALMAGMHRVLMLVAVTIPFGMLAAIGLPAVGGLSVLATSVAAAALVGVGCLALLSALVRGAAIRVEPASLAIGLYAAYAVFSATVLVRLFAGESMVFSLSRNAAGVKVSTLFSWGKVWLAPSNTNISQTFYVVLACGFFIVAVQVLSRHGTALGGRAMAAAAAINIVLGVMDLAALDPILNVVRTASYSLSNEATVNGIPRVIGGYSEAASFGTACAMFFAYFASSFVDTGRPRDGLLALGNGAFAALALSATGIIALGAVCCVLAVKTIGRIPARVQPGQLVAAAIGILVLTVIVSAVLTLTPAPEVIAAVIDDLILNKSQSASGYERKAWAMGGLDALIDTWGLGAGTGSRRSNGLVFVLLVSVGIVGTAAFALFLGLAFGGKAVAGQAAALSSARLGALAVLVSMTLTATVPDPTVPLILLAAIAVSARRPQPLTAPGIAARQIGDDDTGSGLQAVHQ